MVPARRRPAANRRSRPFLDTLQPVDAAPFRLPSSPLLIWGSLMLVWLLSLLPWRLWLPAPDLMLLLLVFWCVNEPGRIGMLSAFVFGLLMDVHDGALLGEHALTYVLAAYGGVALHRRLQRFNAVAQAIHLLPVFVGAVLVAHAVQAWLLGGWNGGWSWLWSSLLTLLLWPLLDFLIYLPQRRLDAPDGDSV